MNILGELVEDLFEAFGHIHLLFLQGVKDTHQGATGMGASIGGRAETDLAGDDGGSEVAFCEVVFSRDLSVLCPMIEAMSVLSEEILNVSDSRVEGVSPYSGNDLGFGFSGPLKEFAVMDGLVSETHGRGQKGGHDTDKGFDFLGIGEVLFEVLDVSEQMGITVLERARSPVIPSVTIHHKDARQGLIS